MSRDSSRTHLHLRAGAHADLFEEFTRTPLHPDTIYLPPQHQPLNPEDEDDVVPDQHAAFGIAKATKETREPAWRDLRLAELVAANAREGETSAGAGAQASGGQEAEITAQGNVGAVGPASGTVRVPVPVRAGMRNVGLGNVGSDLRG